MHHYQTLLPFMKEFNPCMSLRKLDRILAFKPVNANYLIPYDVAYGKTVTYEKNIQFLLFSAAAFHHRQILVY